MHSVVSSDPRVPCSTQGVAGRFVAGRAALGQALLLAWRLFRRDVAAKYRYAALGVVWAIITPLFLVGLFLVLDRSNVVNATSSGNLPYSVFAITGVTIWGIFSTGISSAAESLNSAGATMLRMKFPRAALVLAAIGMALFEFIVRLPVVVIAWGAVGHLSPGGLVLGLVSLLPLLVLTLALGMAAAVCAVMLRDVLHLIPILMTLLMLISPVLYAFPPDTILGRLNVFNPLHHFLVTARNLFAGEFQVSLGYWLSAAGSVVLLGLSWRLFRVAQAKVLEWM